MANRGATIVTNDGHANPKKRALEIDNNGYSTTDPYLLAAAQALSSTASAKRAALDKSGLPFYQPTITAAAYPFNLQQYQQLTPAAAAIPALPGASYFPAAAFTRALGYRKKYSRFLGLYERKWMVCRHLYLRPFTSTIPLPRPIHYLY
uniref:Uncharacterized protein n=1 Tax=Romanomermis culicivorax TaxID=13658 RepID=A0A915LAC4_ROMCU